MDTREGPFLARKPPRSWFREEIRSSPGSQEPEITRPIDVGSSRVATSTEPLRPHKENEFQAKS